MARDIKQMSRVELESELVAERAAARRGNMIIVMMTVLAVLGFMVMGRHACTCRRLTRQSGYETQPEEPDSPPSTRRRNLAPLRMVAPSDSSPNRQDPISLTLRGRRCSPRILNARASAAGPTNRMDVASVAGWKHRSCNSFVPSISEM